jgi:hypothetical protein
MQKLQNLIILLSSSVYPLPDIGMDCSVRLIVQFLRNVDAIPRYIVGIVTPGKRFGLCLLPPLTIA